MTIKRFLLILCFLPSCSDSKNEDVSNNPSSNSETNYNDTTIVKQSNQLALKYNAVQSDDTSLTYTYKLQNEVFQLGRPMALRATVIDIFQRDTSYLLKCLGAFANKVCVAEIEVSEQQLEQLNRNLIKPSKGLFVFKPTNIISRIPREDLSNDLIAHIFISGTLLDMEFNKIKSNY